MNRSGLPPSYWTCLRRRKKARLNANVFDNVGSSPQQTASVAPIRSNATAERPVDAAGDVSVNADPVEDTVSDVLSDDDSEVIGSSNGISASDITDDSDDNERFSAVEELDAAPVSPGKPTAADFRNDLGTWVVNRNINLDAADELLAILRHHGMVDLPKTARSLLSTPRKVALKEIPSGQYFHFGITHSCRYGLGQSSLPLPPAGTQFNLYVNVDGVNVNKSTPAEFYPILGKLTYHIDSVEHVSVVFLIGLFHGDSGKPGCAVEFLKDFVDDCNQVQASGLTLIHDHQRINYPLKLRAVVCDAPARAFVKCVKAHGGYYACDYCETKGEHYATHGVVYPQRSAPLRTDAKFRTASTEAYKCHLMGRDRSPLLGIAGFDVISDVTPEYMHTVTLGVMKKNMGMWCNRSSEHKVRVEDVQNMSDRLMDCSEWCPREMGRKPRGLNQRDKFKATEWRSILLYTGFFIFKGILTDERYQHHLLLACSMKILLSDALCSKYHDVAKRMLNRYVKQYVVLYGRDNIVYNVHMLIHFADAAHSHGSLERIGAFAFESYMSSLRAVVRKPKQTLTQVVKREAERRKLKLPKERDSTCSFKNPHTGGCVPKSMGSAVRQFRTVVSDGVRFACAGGDSFVYVRGEGVARIDNLLSSPAGKAIAAVRFFQHVWDHFTEPLASSQLGVWRVSKLSDNVKARPLEMCRKVWFMPVSKDYSLCVELAHSMDL